MIFIGGGGGAGLLVAGFVLLLLMGSGDAFPLIMLLLFFGLPFLLIRSMIRSGRQTMPLPAGGGWQTPTYPPPQRQQSGWQPPAEPVLPRVSAADVSSLRDRLGHDVSTLEPGTDPVARQALADAAERPATSSTLLERATTDAQLRTAWLAAVEGLQAAKVVRRQLGLDPGPPVPTLPTTGPQLTQHARVEVAGRSHEGAPTYEPGRPHWFPGGYYGGRPVPGGWYDAPFWPSALVLGGLGGWALGGLMADAMFGNELYLDDTGLDGGFDDGGVDDGGAGGDWDGGGDGGTDWGSGSGGFGGFGGGGDWGGGGSDWSGGDWGGGGDWGSGGDFGGGGGGDW